VSPICCTAVTPPSNLAWAVGDELQRARHDLEWSQQELVQRVPGVNGRKLSRAEFGHRPCSLDTLVNLCWAMAVAPADLLELGMQRMHLDIERLTLHVDLPSVAADTRFTRLWSLRRWAADRLARGLHRHGVVRIPPAAVATLAAALSIKTHDIAGYLARKPPHTIRGSTTCTTRTTPIEQPPTLTKAELAAALGGELRRIRTDNQLTVEDVARRLMSISARALSLHENGRTLSSLAQLIDLGDALDIPAPRLLHQALRNAPDPLAHPACIANSPPDAHSKSDATHPHAAPAARHSSRSHEGNPS
jgi:transcriptional regulator with XRE-family HTH domain